MGKQISGHHEEELFPHRSYSDRAFKWTSPTTVKLGDL